MGRLKYCASNTVHSPGHTATPISVCYANILLQIDKTSRVSLNTSMNSKFVCRLIKLLPFLLVILFTLLLFRLYMYPFTKKHSNLRGTEETTNSGSSNVSKHFSKEPENPKLVLFYTTLWGRTPWPTVENDYQFNSWNNVACKVRNCKISYDKRDLNASDAVLFHVRDINIDLIKLSSSLVEHRFKQRWIFFNHESPENSFTDLSNLKNVFNWTMTYKSDSDIFVPYAYYFQKTGKNAEHNSSKDYSKGKDRLVAWTVSHCGKQRDKLVKKLMEYISVHVYGGCASKFSQNRQCRRGDENCMKTLRRYKFYLAFENGNCIDYISEKYWINSLQNDIVPVVFGGGNYSNSKLAVPGSYINVMDFKSAKDLADYLVMLDKNDTAYNEYFSWKERYYVDVPPSWTCKLCAMLNNDSLPRKSYDHEYLETFYGRQSNCGLLDEKFDKIISD